MTPTPAAPGPARMETFSPRLLKAGAVVAVCLYGVLLMLPVVISLLAVSLVQLGVWTWLVPLLAVAFVTFFLPFGFGNPYVARLVRRLGPAPGPAEESFIVQLTVRPRVREGLRALVEDADDVGWLTYTESALVFQGDSMRLSVPFDCIRGARTQTIGLRGLFLYPCMEVAVSGLPGTQSLRFAERSAAGLPACRRRSVRMFHRLMEKTKPLG